MGGKTLASLPAYKIKLLHDIVDKQLGVDLREVVYNVNEESLHDKIAMLRELNYYLGLTVINLNSECKAVNEVPLQ